MDEREPSEHDDLVIYLFKVFVSHVVLINSGDSYTLQSDLVFSYIFFIEPTPPVAIITFATVVVAAVINLLDYSFTLFDYELFYEFSFYNHPFFWWVTFG